MIKEGHRDEATLLLPTLFYAAELTSCLRFSSLPSIHAPQLELCPRRLHHAIFLSWMSQSLTGTACVRALPDPNPMAMQIPAVLNSLRHSFFSLFFWVGGWGGGGIMRLGTFSECQRVFNHSVSSHLTENWKTDSHSPGLSSQSTWWHEDIITYNIT